MSCWPYSYGNAGDDGIVGRLARQAEAAASGMLHIHNYCISLPLREGGETDITTYIPSVLSANDSKKK